MQALTFAIAGGFFTHLPQGVSVEDETPSVKLLELVKPKYVIDDIYRSSS